MFFSMIKSRSYSTPAAGIKTGEDPTAFFDIDPHGIKTWGFAMTR